MGRTAMLPVRSAIRRIQGVARGKTRSVLQATRQCSSQYTDDDDYYYEEEEDRGFFARFQSEPEEWSENNGAPRIPSYWNKWFPYEPVPCSPQLSPYKVAVEQGQIYYWCSCGECRTQPWCEDSGGPAGCQSRGFEAMLLEPVYTGTVSLCGCKDSSAMPYCNGTCFQVWMDNNMVPATALIFGSCFVSSIFFSWMMHP